METEAIEALEALTTRFERLLAEEEQALRGHDATAVEALADTKGQLVAALEAWLARLTLAPGDDAERDARAHLHQRLAACQHLNRLNGALIEANRSFNTLLLDALRGQPGARAQVYGRRGDLSDIRGSATLGRA